MRKRRWVSVAGTAALLLSGLGVAGPATSAHAFGYNDLTPMQKRHASGVLQEELGSKVGAKAVTAPRRATPSCARRIGVNVKVNQNCLNVTDQPLAGRGQAQNETWLSVNPNNPRQVISSYNDYRRGDGTCGVSYSGDGGRTWADTTTPNGFVYGTAFGGTAREYFQAGGDTSVAWDSRGNAYLSCQMFKRGAGVTEDVDTSSGFYVFRSTGNGGASFNFPGRPVAQLADLSGTGVLLDKQLMTIDNHPSSPYRDRIYLTWTTYAADGSGYLYGAYSSDYGETFSDPVLIGPDSPLCTDNFGQGNPHGNCNNNSFSQPVTGPDGALYVAWANYNVAQSGTDNHFQVLVARSTDGGKTFSAPVKAANYYDLPDCDTYQGAGKDPGRDCVVEKGSSTNSIFRATNYPYLTVDPRNPKHVVVSVGSYINKDSNETTGCSPAGLLPFSQGLGSLYNGVKTVCANHIVLSDSTNGAASFTGTTTDVRKLPVIGETSASAKTDQFWQGLTFSPRGTLVSAYYDRQYGTDNTTGYSDITVSTTTDLRHFSNTRVTSSSMPPPTQFNGQFYGDYVQVDATATTAYPLWSDTRTNALFTCPGVSPPALCTGAAGNATVANDEEIFTAAVPIH